MARLTLTYEALDEGVRVRVVEKSLLQKGRAIPVDSWSEKADGRILNAISRLISWADDEGVIVGDENILLPHSRVASLDASTANLIGLPPVSPFVINVQSQGTIDQQSFKLRTTWLELTGQTAIGVTRRGAILSRGSGDFRLPEPLFGLIEALEHFNAETREDSAGRLKAWATVQDLLQLRDIKNIKSEGYLLNTRIAHAAAFSLSLKTAESEFDFDPVLFGPNVSAPPEEVDLEEDEEEPERELVSEASHLLPPVQQKFFAENRFLEFHECRDRYALKDGWYVVLDEPVRKALNVVYRAKRSNPETRKAFAKNPRAYIRDALGDDADDALLDNIFIETSEYSERVLDIGIWEPPVVPWIQRKGDTWLPEKFGLKVGDQTIFLEEPEVLQLRNEVEKAIAAKTVTISWKGDPIPASPSVLEAIDALIGEVKPNGRPKDEERKAEEPGEDQPTGRVVLIIDDNLEQAGTVRHVVPRQGGPSERLAYSLRTSLKQHQVEGITWLQDAWRKGQKGVLLADDMGLGKTLLTLAFLAWLRRGMDEKGIRRSPILVVAPTGLLRNWEQEHDLHMHSPGLGECLRAYGSDLRGLRQSSEKEIDIGQSTLDTSKLRDAHWMLTTYETLRDYQHSFAAIKFAVIVFDEIQKIKTPGSIMTHAAKAMNGDFHIGLTGTPIENRLADLWCIVDTLEPGYLGDLKAFSQTFEKDVDAETLARLKNLLTKPQDGLKPVMLRRMKDDNLKGLPEKTVHVSDATMPPAQRKAYSDAIVEAQQNRGPGRMLETLHRLKSISLHPYHPLQAEYPDYLSESARFELLFKTLDDIAAKGERALIFVESRDMQEPLAGFIKRRYELPVQPLIISGAVSGPKRQQRVNEFQNANSDHPGFNVMILSPRAGGVGLTLTAANHVFHLSRWWNPAVEDQCTDRVFRIGQTKPVHVYHLHALHPDFPNHSFDERLHALLERKRTLSRDMLIPPVDQARDTDELYSATVEQRSDAEEVDGCGEKTSGSAVILTLDDIDTMEPLQFENWCLGKLKSAGFAVSKTPKSWDCGADGLAEHRQTGECIIIQCKHTQTNVPCSDHAVHELLAARKAYDRPDAILCAVTNATAFSAGARALAEIEGVRLVWRNSLLGWP